MPGKRPDGKPAMPDDGGSHYLSPPPDGFNRTPRDVKLPRPLFPAPCERKYSKTENQFPCVPRTPALRGSIHLGKVKAMISSLSSSGSSDALALLQQLLAKAAAAGTTTTSTAETDTAMSEELFTQLDSDGDGAISKTEFSSFTSRFSAETGFSLVAAQESDSTSSTTGDELFTSLDTDNNGSLSESELAVMSPPPPPPEADDASLQALFDSIDANGDGSIDEEELAAALQPPTDTATETDTTTDTTETTAAAGGSGTSSSSDSYDALDINKDGVVSLEERMAGASQQNTPTTGKLSAGTLSSLLNSVNEIAA